MLAKSSTNEKSYHETKIEKTCKTKLKSIKPQTHVIGKTTKLRNEVIVCTIKMQIERRK